MLTYSSSLTSIAFTPLIVSYTVEILPFALRAKGFTVFNFVISLALIFNQYVNPIALRRLSWRYYVRTFRDLSLQLMTKGILCHKQLVYMVWLLFETAFCYFYIIETRGRTLEETAAMFDGEDATDHIANVGHQQVTAADEKMSVSGHSKEEVA